jgi:short-subunit dehydrogenase
MTNRNHYALLTGATSGVGLELAKLLARDGYNLVIIARDRETLGNAGNELSDRYQVKVVTLYKNIFERNAATEIYEEMQSAGIVISILVNDASQSNYGAFVHTDIERELVVVQQNISTLIILTKLFLTDMVARGEGKILNVASVAGKLPGPLQAVYQGTKAFVHSFTEAVREEVKHTGVTVTSLLPGATATDFFNKAKMLQANNIRDKKLATAADVAMNGYEALMNGEDMVIAGFLNKVQFEISNILPDATVADAMYKQQID